VVDKRNAVIWRGVEACFERSATRSIVHVLYVDMRRRLRMRSMMLIATGSVLAVSVLAGASSGQASGMARSIPTASAALSTRELETAIGLFARFNPDLFESNEAFELGGRWLRPAFAPLQENKVVGPTTKLVNGLVSGEARELSAFVTGQDGEGTEISLYAKHEAERLVDGVALVDGGIERQTDVLVRPVPFGFSFYVQFRSASAPERVSLNSGVGCAPGGSELITRLGAGTFAVEGPSGAEVECERYSRARVPAQASPAPWDTVANYRHERRLLELAERRARRGRAEVRGVLSAATARDATGRVVPTDMSWRYDEEPVLRVHFAHGHYRYPIVVRVDLLVEAR
jgi:hypothetical protein